MTIEFQHLELFEHVSKVAILLSVPVAIVVIIVMRILRAKKPPKIAIVRLDALNGDVLECKINLETGENVDEPVIISKNNG